MTRENVMADAPVRSVVDIVTDFLGSAPTLEQIAAYRLASVVQERAHQLLDENRSGSLSDEERIEMEEYRQIDHLLTLIKAKARLKAVDRRL